MSSPRRLWPDPRQTLLLHAALASTAGQAADAWRQIRDGLSLDGLDPGSDRLLPLVWSNLTRLGLSDECLAALGPRHVATRDANLARLREAGEVLGALGASGIPTVVLKGAALLACIYDDAGVRPFGDVDILVPVARVDAASRVLRELGFAPQSPMTPAALALTHSIPWAGTGRSPVDLHWHVFEECCRADDDDELWAASVDAEIGGAATRVLSREDQLMHACVHGEKWVYIPGIRWIADAVAIMRDGGVAWDRLVDQAITRGFVSRLRAQLAYLAREFAAPVPEATLEALAIAPTSRLDRFEHRFGVRDRRRPWALVYWCNHVRATPGGLVQAAATFPKYLQAVWRLESARQIPRAAVTKLMRRR